MTSGTPTTPPASTDDAPAGAVMAAVCLCAMCWQPQARIIGDVRAGDIERAIREWGDRIEKMEAALRKIDEHGWGQHSATAAADLFQTIAREALSNVQ